VVITLFLAGWFFSNKFFKLMEKVFGHKSKKRKRRKKKKKKRRRITP